MTSAEAKAFFHEALIAFPGVFSWLKENSPDVSATLRKWGDALSEITHSEAMSVLSRWVSGKLPAPIGYEKEHFHLHVRAVVLRDRSEAKRITTRDEFQKLHRRGESITKHHANLGPYMAEVNRVYRQWCAGTITENDRDKQIDLLQKQAIANVK